MNKRYKERITSDLIMDNEKDNIEVKWKRLEDAIHEVANLIKR